MKKFLPKTKNNSSGFTLIELLVVISIIAFLAVIGIAAYSQVQKQARDGRRKADIDAISQAYESNYNAVAGTYATLATGQFASGATPQDPTNSGSYVYTGNTVNGAKGFWTCATLEISTGNTNAGGGATTCPAAGVASSTCYPTFLSTNAGALYCKASQQGQ